MLKIITVTNVRNIIDKHGLNNIFKDLVSELEKDFGRWDDFQKMARPAFHSTDGVFEMMPASTAETFTAKFVNGHPINTERGKFCVAATGLIADMDTGYQKAFTEMTVMTAIRTAATSVMASKYLARKDSQSIGIIGNGAQSEFQILAHLQFFDIKKVYYYDVDSAAMNKLATNLGNLGLELIPCNSASECAKEADIVITVTADKKMAIILEEGDVKKGQTLLALGGDCPGKTEMSKAIVEQSKVYVEYIPQSHIEGEIQVFEDPQEVVYAELHEVITGHKEGRVNDQEMILFDSVGFGIEDFSTLQLFYRLAEKYDEYQELDMIPEVDDVKNLYSLVRK